MSILLGDLLGSTHVASIVLGVIDVAIVAYVIYRILQLLKGTRAISVLIGLLLVIFLFFVSKQEYLGLSTLNWIIEKFISYFILIVIVIFQNDIRRGLAQVGRHKIFSRLSPVEETKFFEELVKACVTLANRKIGAIIAIQRNADLSGYLEEGTKLDAKVTKELLLATFLPDHQNPLHDGAVIIQEGRISAAGCFLPLTMNQKLDKQFGTRHRAAIGLGEETDAVVIVVSEERGAISVVNEGRLNRDIDGNTLRNILQTLYGASAMDGEPVLGSQSAKIKTAGRRLLDKVKGIAQ